MHELAIWRQLDDPDQHVNALNALATTFLAHDRRHCAMDCAEERLSVHLNHHRHREAAEDLRHLGQLKLRANRPDTAIDYLTRTSDALDNYLASQPSTTPTFESCWAGHCGAQVRHPQLGAKFTHALQALVDIDDHAADPSPRTVEHTCWQGAA
ncbi:hypothetical protein [Actinocrispum wychmicini]|nr:hypothetical protein [Actinocrispum wychmicini]